MTKPNYNDYTQFLEENGWTRKHVIITEIDTDYVTIYSSPIGRTGTVIILKCPHDEKISVMGTKQVPDGLSLTSAYPLKIKLANIDDKETSQFTSLRIAKISDMGIDNLKKVFYSDVRVNDIDKQYRFDEGFEINGFTRGLLSIDVLANSIGYINLPDIDIDKNNTKFSLECDIWTGE